MATSIEINREEFRKIGHRLIDELAGFFDTIEKHPVTTGETPEQIQKLIGTSSLPEKGLPADVLISKASDLLLNHSLLNGHPKFFGYITGSPAPIGALADLLAATVNPNVGANILSPVATEIEKQTVKWLAEFIGYSPDCGGLLVSGGNMANFTAFLAGRTAKAGDNFKKDGIANTKHVVYCAKSTHIWIEKAAVLFGHGTNAIRWIETTPSNKMKNDVLEQTIKDDLKNGLQPMMAIGNAGDVSTGAVDDLKAIASICKKFDLWFHIDGAYGIPAAVLPEMKTLFEGMEEADSIALDPHKWLYSPLEAGCTLVKNPAHLLAAYSSHPVYYNFSHSDGIPVQNFYEYGFQNSRGFRALKVWLMLQQAGKEGYKEMISRNINLAEMWFEKADSHNELEAVAQNLSIVNFRYHPAIDDSIVEKENYINKLNEALLNKLQLQGEVFMSNAVVQNKYCLRACIVNFRTSEKDIQEVIDIVIREGRAMHETMKLKA